MVEPQIVVLVVAGSSPVGHPASQIPNPKFQTSRSVGWELKLGFWDLQNVPVAQPDRASDFGSEGWGFESLQARTYEKWQFPLIQPQHPLPLCCPYFLAAPRSGSRQRCRWLRDESNVAPMLSTNPARARIVLIAVC
jgi:hypothetical protein